MSVKLRWEGPPLGWHHSLAGILGYMAEELSSSMARFKSDKVWNQDELIWMDNLIKLRNSRTGKTAQ